MLISTGRDYVSEERPATGVLFIPQMIYEYGEPRWKNGDRGNRRTQREIRPSVWIKLNVKTSSRLLKPAKRTSTELTVWLQTLRLPWNANSLSQAWRALAIILGVEVDGFGEV
jgi:hypothetical protein